MALCKSKLQNPKYQLNKLQTLSHEDLSSFNSIIGNGNVFRKQRIFIDDISNAEYNKLKRLLQELKAEVLDTFDENVNYVIVANNKLKAPLRGLNDKLNSSNSSLQSKLSQAGSKKILKSRQIQKVLSSNLNNNGNEPVLTNSEGWNFILHLQKLKIPALSFMEVFKWINMYHSNLIEEIEIKNQNKVLDKNKMIRLIGKPGLKLGHTHDIYAPEYMSNCNFEYMFWQETCLNETNEKSDIETCESKTISDFSKKCQKSSKLLKPVIGNVKKKKVKSDERYCECCDVKYKNDAAHVESAQHMDFVNNTSKFTGINQIISDSPDFDPFFKIRKRKQKALERIESRKLIKQLSVNDFKNEIVKHPVIIENSERNELSINKTTLNIDIEIKSSSLETIGNISGPKVDNIIEQVIVEQSESNVINLETNFAEVVDSSAIKISSLFDFNNDNITQFNDSKENILPSLVIEKLKFPMKNVNIDSNENNENENFQGNELSAEVTENLTTTNKISKSVKKKKSRLSLKLRKPCYGKFIENITESGDVLNGFQTHYATVSEYRFECHIAGVSNHYFHTSVVSGVSEFNTINEQEILPMFKHRQASCRNISYGVIKYDKNFIVNHMLWAPINVLTEILGQCSKMTIPDFMSLNPIDVTTLFNVATTMVVNPQIFNSSYDISIIKKIPVAHGYVLNNTSFELATASVETITAISNEGVEIVSVLENSVIQYSDEESLIIESAALNDSFGSSIEMLSSYRYNVKLDTTSDSLQTPLSPITSDYKHHAFSPFIVRSANKSSVDHGFSPEFSISPHRYVSDNSFEFDIMSNSNGVATTKNDKIQKPNLLSPESCIHRNSKSQTKQSTKSSKDDLILNLKKIVAESDLPGNNFFDILSDSKLTNSKQKLLFSVDSFVENHFLKRFDLNLSSDRKYLQEVTNQRAVDIDLKSKKRIRPETGFSSPDNYHSPLIGNATKKQRRKIESNSSQNLIFESPVSRRPFRRAKYIARESISISTQLYLN